jgi:hypothetical protein
MARAKKVDAMSATPFASLSFTAAPAPERKAKSKPTPPPVPDSLLPLIDAVRTTPTGVDLSIVGWTEEQIKLLERVLRGNRASLFPENRLYVLPVDTDRGPALRIRLGKLGRVN